MLPVSLVDDRTPLYRWLVGYKRLPERVAAAHARRLGTLLALFWARHRRCVAPGGVDLVAVVPSGRSDGQPGESGDWHPLTSVLRAVPELADRLTPVLQPVRSRVRRNLADSEGFALSRPVAPDRRVLLVDDTYTTGAHLQSAAAFLSRRGVRHLVLMVLGRRVHGRWSKAGSAGTPQACTPPWSPDTCASCACAPAGTGLEDPDTIARLCR